MNFQIDIFFTHIACNKLPPKMSLCLKWSPRGLVFMSDKLL